MDVQKQEKEEHERTMFGKKKKNGKFGKTLGCKKHEEEYENCRRYGQRGEYGRVRENVIRCRK